MRLTFDSYFLVGPSLHRMTAVWLLICCPCLLFLVFEDPTTAHVEKSAKSTMSSLDRKGPRFVIVFLTHKCSKR